MTIIEIILSVLNLLLVSGGLVVLATIRSTVKTSKANAQGAATDANDKLMNSYEQHILTPVLNELATLRTQREEWNQERNVLRQQLEQTTDKLTRSNEKTNRKLDRLTKAIEKIPECDYSRNHQCPVSLQLRNSATDSADDIRDLRDNHS